METNSVYAAGVAQIDRDLLTGWLGDEKSKYTPAVLDCVITVPVGESGPGKMREEGPAQATAAHVSSAQKKPFCFGAAGF